MGAGTPLLKAPGWLLRGEEPGPAEKRRRRVRPDLRVVRGFKLRTQAGKDGRPLAGMNSPWGTKCYMNNRKIAFNYVLGLIVKLRLQNLFMFHGLLVL